VHPELAGLIAGLHLDPADDALWLVTADWLEENGQPCPAELMRGVRRLSGVPEGPARRDAESRVWALLRAGVRPVVPTIANPAGLDLVLIPPGEFLTGSPDDEDGRYDDESPRVLMKQGPFYLGRTAVTQRQYHRLTNKRPSGFKSTGRMKARIEGLDTSDFPVERVTWHDAVEFCTLLGELPEEKAAGRRYRLPTEFEWEYACRGEASRMSPYPHGPDLTTDLVNFRATGVKSRDHLNRPVPAGSLPPNAFGLHEMTGNVWEWCADNFDGEDAHNRNARGGTFALEARRARTADRSSFEPNHRDHDLGFRVLLEWRAATRRQRI